MVREMDRWRGKSWTFEHSMISMNWSLWNDWDIGSGMDNSKLKAQPHTSK